MKATEVHQIMLESVRSQAAQGEISNRVMAAAGQGPIHSSAHINGARAHCDGKVLVVTAEQATYILGDGYADWDREATLEEVESLPDTRGNQRRLADGYTWFGER